MGLLEQLDEILTTRLNVEVEKVRALRGARLLGTGGRVVVEKILQPAPDNEQKPESQQEHKPQYRDSGTGGFGEERPREKTDPGIFSSEGQSRLKLRDKRAEAAAESDAKRRERGNELLKELEGLGFGAEPADSSR